MLIITGPPGAGKSTVARAVAERSERAVCIEADWFWTTIVSGFVAPWLPESDAQNRAVLRAFLSAAAELEHGGFDTVIDGIVGPWMFDVVADVLGDRTEQLDYLVLRPSLETCLERATTRASVERVPGHPPLTDFGPIRHMWAQFADLGEFEPHVLDTTALTVDETIDAVVQRRERGAARLHTH